MVLAHVSIFVVKQEDAFSFEWWKHVSLLQPVISTFVHWTTVITSLSKALNPSTAPVALCCSWHSQFYYVSVCPCLCPSHCPCHPSHGFSSTCSYSVKPQIAEDGFQQCMPCKTGIWKSLVFEAHSIIHHPFFHPSVHRIHPCIYKSIRHHLSINPLLFERIHPCFRKDKIPEEACLFLFKAAILDTISGRAVLFYHKVNTLTGGLAQDKTKSFHPEKAVR